MRHSYMPLMTHAHASMISRNVAVTALIMQFLTAASPAVAVTPALTQAAQPVAAKPVQQTVGPISGAQGSQDLAPCGRSDVGLTGLAMVSDAIQVQITVKSMTTLEQTP